MAYNPPYPSGAAPVYDKNTDPFWKAAIGPFLICIGMVLAGSQVPLHRLWLAYIGGAMIVVGLILVYVLHSDNKR